jgi:MFS transporter, ACS family, tartrate transporter
VGSGLGAETQLPPGRARLATKPAAIGSPTVRFLLGAAEAGFFPGIILFLTYWFPAEYRARMVGRFMAAIPISTVIGAPVRRLSPHEIRYFP